MDIRTKLVFALVAVALGSMLTFGALMYGSADHRLRDAAVNQLAGLAESRSDALEETITGWRESVQLIGSRTQLRLSLRDYARGEDPGAPARISRILQDARSAVTHVASVAVYDAEGRLVTGAGLPADTVLPADTMLPEPRSGSTLGSRQGVRYGGVSFTGDERPILRFVTDLLLDGERIGTLLVLLTGQDLIDLTADFTGLGETGEVMIVMRDAEGVRTIHPVRHPMGTPAGSLRIDGPDDPAVRALSGTERVFTEGLTDYRGERVWAATRYVPETDWGLVVKFDRDEGRAPVLEYRREMLDLALSLAAFAILIAVLLGIRFANPIHDLAETANRIRVGELDARANVAREDEIGLLSRTFNHMADELEERMTLLHEFQKFFELSLDMLCIAGTDGYFKRTNPAFERTLGWRSEELLSRPFFDLIHPEDVPATQREIEKLAEGIPTISFVNRFRCADGTYKCLRWTSHPEPETGLLYAVAREIRDGAAIP